MHFTFSRNQTHTQKKIQQPFLKANRSQLCFPIFILRMFVMMCSYWLPVLFSVHRLVVCEHRRGARLGPCNVPQLTQRHPGRFGAGCLQSRGGWETTRSASCRPKENIHTRTHSLTQPYAATHSCRPRLQPLVKPWSGGQNGAGLRPLDRSRGRRGRCERLPLCGCHHKQMLSAEEIRGLRKQQGAQAQQWWAAQCSSVHCGWGESSDVN